MFTEDKEIFSSLYQFQMLVIGVISADLLMQTSLPHLLAWSEVRQGLLYLQMAIIGSCHKYFCCDKHAFCCDKSMLVMTKIFCCEKTFVAKHNFVTTKVVMT